MAERIKKRWLKGVKAEDVYFFNIIGRPAPWENENDKNKRAIGIFLDDKTAKQMKEEGWYVRMTKVKKEGDIPKPYVEVIVNFDSPYSEPKVFLVEGDVQTRIKADDAIELQQLFNEGSMLKMDIKISPYTNYSFYDKYGAVAFVDILGFHAEVDPIAAEYMRRERGYDAPEYPTEDDGELPFI